MTVGKVTDQKQDAAYHCGIDWLLQAAYLLSFNKMEMGKCKTKFPTFDEWYATLNHEQRGRVEKALSEHFHPSLIKFR